MTTRILILFVFTSILLLPPCAQAQVHYKAKTLTARNGLSDNRVTCLHKDRKGFMWMGTKNGLNRYDGHTFRVFRPGPGNSISNEVINDIAEDSRGRIWVATMEGISIYDTGKDSWTYILPDTGSSVLSIPNLIVWDIAIDKNDIAWIACDVFAFSAYDIKTGKFSYYDWTGYSRTDPNIAGVRYKSIQRFVPGKGDELWLGTTRGLVQLNTATRQFSFAGGGYYGDVVDLRYDAETGKVFVSTEHAELFMYDENKKRYEKLPVANEPYPSTRFGPVPRAELWLASRSGLLKINSVSQQVRLEVNIPQLSGSLLPGGVNSIFEDDLHDRWIGTANGVSIYSREGLSSSFIPLLPVSDREGSNNMGGAYFDSRSKSYFVCSINPAAVFIISSEDQQVKKIIADESGRPLMGCVMVKRDANDSLWLLTANHLYRYSRATGKFTLFPTPYGNEEIVFRDMLQDKEGNYWFASFHRGILFYNSRMKVFQPLPDTNINHLSSATGLSYDEQNGNLLISSFGVGVLTYHPGKGKITAYYPSSENVPEYSQIILINGMAADVKGAIWLGSASGGVYKYETGKPFEKTFARFDMRSGLVNNNVISLCSNGDSVMWMLTGSGIAAVNLSGKFLYGLSPEEVFDFSAYGSDSRFPHPIGYNKEGQELLVAVGGGLFRYAAGAKHKLPEFPLVLTAVNVNGKQLSQEMYAGGRRFELPFRSNAIQFEFAGLYYGPSLVSYEYKLDGYDREWVPSAGNYFTAYQNLPPGRYQFHINAKDREGNIVAALSSLSFRIVPPFWRRWWFFALAALLFLAAIGYIIRSLRQKLKVERTVTSFATSLYGQNSTEDIFWDTARNCIEKLGFMDCVVYQRDEIRDVLVQKAAFGPKNPQRREIVNIIEVPVGKGIVGAVAQAGKPVMIANTARDKRYIVDDQRRLSEIAVPVIVDGKVFAVIDSEHPKKNFYSGFHLRVLKKIAAICSEKITKHLTEERLRAKIARDLHDEMGSTLTSINIISKVAMDGNTGEEKSKEYFQKIKDHSSRMMESMSDMVWAINPVNDSFGKVILRMKEFAAEILEPARITYYFDDSGLQREIVLNPEQRKNIYLIFKEAVNNVVKYSNAGEVNIIFSTQGPVLKMLIADNGTGFDPTAESSGNGLRNMQFRATEMGGFIKLESIPGTGTSVNLQLPVT